MNGTTRNGIYNPHLSVGYLWLSDPQYYLNVEIKNQRKKLAQHQTTNQ